MTNNFNFNFSPEKNYTFGYMPPPSPPPGGFTFGAPVSTSASAARLIMSDETIEDCTRVISLVGTNFRSYRIDEPFTWKLVNEPDNPHDSEACFVALNGGNVGYVPRQQNSELNASTCDIQKVDFKVSRGQISIMVTVKMKKFEEKKEDCDSASHVCKRKRQCV